MKYLTYLVSSLPYADGFWNFDRHKKKGKVEEKHSELCSLTYTSFSFSANKLMNREIKSSVLYVH